MAVLLEIDAERGAHGRDGAGQDHALPRGARFHHAEAVGPRERLHLGYVCRIGAVTLGVGLAGEVLAGFGRLGRQKGQLGRKILFSAAAQPNGDFEALIRMDLTDLLGAGNGLFLAAGQRNAILLGHG